MDGHTGKGSIRCTGFIVRCPFL